MFFRECTYADFGRDILGMPKSKSTGNWEEKKLNELQNEQRDKAVNKFNELKLKYKQEYDYIKNNGGTDKLFNDFVTGYETNELVKKDVKYGLDDEDAFDLIAGKSYERSGMKTLIPVDKNGKEGTPVSLNELQSTGKDKFVPTGQILVDKYGDIRFNANGKQWKINKEVMPEQIKVDKQDIDDLSDALYTRGLTQEKQQQLSKKRWGIGPLSVRVELDPKNPLEPRKLKVIDTRDELGTQPEFELSDPSAIQKYITQTIYKGLSNKHKKQE